MSALETLTDACTTITVTNASTFYQNNAAKTFDIVLIWTWTANPKYQHTIAAPDFYFLL